MGEKTAGVGHFTIPTAPAAGTSVTSGAANTFTTTPVVLSASAPSTLFITGVHLESSAALAATYIVVQLMSGGSGSETIIGQYLVPLSTASTVALGYRAIYPFIPVASGTRLTAKTADSVGAKATLVTLECIAQANVVDDGVVQSANVLQWNSTNVSSPATAGIPDVNVKNINNVVAATPGASGGILISGSNSGTTTLGALTITGVTTHTGNVLLSDGLTIAAPSTGNRAGFSIAGNGTGAGMSVTGGATGIGLSVVGGGTSGDGVKVTTTSGHGINLAPVGTSMHGLFATGGNGGTSDGIKAAAGTGGVDLRANQTGNLVGTVSTLTTYTGNTPQTGDAYARLGAPAGASVSADVAAVNAKTTNLPAAPASTTNITAGTITTVTNLTNAPTAGDLTATMKTSVTTAATAATPTAAAVTGAVGSVTGNVGGNVTGSVGSISGVSFPSHFATLAITVGGAVTVGTNGDKTGYALTAAYDAAKTAAPASDVTAIKAKTDSLSFTVAGRVNSNVASVNAVAVSGTGSAGDPWGP